MTSKSWLTGRAGARAGRKCNIIEDSGTIEGCATRERLQRNTRNCFSHRFRAWVGAAVSTATEEPVAEEEPVSEEPVAAPARAVPSSLRTPNPNPNPNPNPARAVPSSPRNRAVRTAWWARPRPRDLETSRPRDRACDSPLASRAGRCGGQLDDPSEAQVLHAPGCRHSSGGYLRGPRPAVSQSGSGRGVR